MSNTFPKQIPTASAHSTTNPDHVPTPYLALWHRTLLQQPHHHDTRSLVYWLQTGRWHADLRIPPERPDFAGVKNLHACDDNQLAWLATQQGFCGTTEVRGARCQWQRHVDFQPDGGRRDIGQMAFNGSERLIEVGIEAEYLEVWQRMPDSVGENAALELASEDGRTPARRTWLLVAGDWFAYVRARAEALPPAASFSELIATQRPTRERLIEWLDFEIGLGRRSGGHAWRIAHSTLPFREGTALFPNGAPERVADGLSAEDDTRRWNVLEWNLGAL